MSPMFSALIHAATAIVITLLGFAIGHTFGPIWGGVFAACMVAYAREADQQAWRQARHNWRMKVEDIDGPPTLKSLTPKQWLSTLWIPGYAPGNLKDLATGCGTAVALGIVLKLWLGV